ncbi:MAG: ABC transporter substrate-binding protein [Methanosarcinaceae archaeon]|nr:ABC transporter substrate-binding protein [Methanosarcinaceae archaeon]
MAVRCMRGRVAVVLFLIFLLVLSAGCTGTEHSGDRPGQGVDGVEYRTVVDSRGVEVQVPTEIERVVTVSDGFIEGIMLALGEEEKIVAVGTSSPQRVYNFTYQTMGGETYEYRDGMQPVTYLSPRIRDLPPVKGSEGVNYETLAGLHPDLVILRVGSCAFYSMDKVQKTVTTIEGLGIPVVVLKAPSCFDEPDLSTISDEIRVLGAVFGKEKRAGELADYLESRTQVIFERTKDIPEAERPNVLVFGAWPANRKSGGGVGDVEGTDTIDSYFIEEIVHAKNVYRGTGGMVPVSAEQLLTLDPDVILLTTAYGYHPAEELYSAPNYQIVSELSAVKNRRVFSFPFEPPNCAKRHEYPIDVMVIAKAAYPDRFADIDLGEWLLDYYKSVYGVDDETARALRSAQWMDWTVEEDF